MRTVAFWDRTRCYLYVTFCCLTCCCCAERLSLVLLDYAALPRSAGTCCCARSGPPRAMLSIFIYLQSGVHLAWRTRRHGSMYIVHFSYCTYLIARSRLTSSGWILINLPADGLIAHHARWLDQVCCICTSFSGTSCWSNLFVHLCMYVSFAAAFIFCTLIHGIVDLVIIGMLHLPATASSIFLLYMVDGTWYMLLL